MTDQARATREGLPGWAWLLVALTIAGGFFWASHIPWHTGQASHHVVYDVTGSGGKSGLITYAVAGGQRQDDGAALPWSHVMDVKARGAGSQVYVSAQNRAASGVVSCSIEVDGKTVAANTSSGAYVVATCSAPLG